MIYPLCWLVDLEIELDIWNLPLLSEICLSLLAAKETRSVHISSVALPFSPYLPSRLSLIPLSAALVSLQSLYSPLYLLLSSHHVLRISLFQRIYFGIHYRFSDLKIPHFSVMDFVFVVFSIFVISSPERDSLLAILQRREMKSRFEKQN